MNRFIFLFFFLAFNNVLCAQETLPVQTVYSSDFNIDEIPRNCLFYIPLNYGKKENYPLLIMLHDDNSNAKNMVKAYGDILQAKADSFDVVIVYPDAAKGKWHSAKNDSINDAGFLSILTDYFIQRYQCNAEQIFVAGLGNSAAMALRFACAIPGKVVAVAPFTTNDSVRKICSDSAIKILPANQISFAGNKISQATFNNMWSFFFLK